MNNNLFLNSPVSTNDFIWIATYSDGTFLSEFSFDSKTENSFYDIEKSKLIRFGLIGYSMNMYFEVLGGVFKIAGRMIEIIYKDKKTNKEYYLTGQPMTLYNDIIQFKNAVDTFDPLGRSIESSAITQYNFGYKKTLNIDDTIFNYKAVCSIPYKHPTFLNIRLVADRDIEDGVLIIRKNGLELFEFDAPIEENVAFELNWEVVA